MSSDEDRCYMLEGVLRDASESVSSWGCNVFTIITHDGLFDAPCLELLQKEYAGQFQVLPASKIPTVEQLAEVLSTRFDKRGKLLGSDYGNWREAWRICLGLQTWPQILIFSNIETLSDDQALRLRSSLKQQESDRSADWPKSIAFILKERTGLHADLRQLCQAVIA